MSKLEKEIERLKSKPKDFTYEELKYLLIKLGFYEYNKGKTSGSSVKFVDNYERKIELHKPHPNNIVKTYKILDIIEKLTEWRLI
ncbi:MAG: type II toxin-antitoxin system HicA family toxin [Clostridia bacterium]|nr:type II toxin-antitoxin system HicA family toxin [Clostridia bacterium]